MRIILYLRILMNMSCRRIMPWLVPAAALCMQITSAWRRRQSSRLEYSPITSVTMTSCKPQSSLTSLFVFPFAFTVSPSALSHIIQGILSSATAYAVRFFTMSRFAYLKNCGAFFFFLWAFLDDLYLSYE